MRVGTRLDRLGSELSWPDLEAFIHYSALDHTTAIYHAVNGHNWSMDTFLAANIFDAVQGQSWQFNRANGGRMKRPKPFPRPNDSQNEDAAEERTIGQAAPLNDIQEFLRRKNGR